jgi:hypothetical protein
VLKSARLVGYNVGNAIAKILSFLDALSIRVCQIKGARRPGGIGFQPEISFKIRSTFVVVILRFGTID